jgi:DNA-directed RNA polymerase specialized sigma54-like protein
MTAQEWAGLAKRLMQAEAATRNETDGRLAHALFEDAYLEAARRTVAAVEVERKEEDK